MNLKTKKWIEAGKILQINPNENVLCPECSIGTLIVKDESIDRQRFDRYLICDNCGKWNVITMNLDDEINKGD